MKGRNEAAAEIREATERFVAECAAVTDDQWLFRPEPAAWSMAHVAEHVAKGNDNLHRVLIKRLLDSPMATRAADVTDAEIPYLFYRGDEPPNVATPSGDWTDRKASCESVNTSSQLIVDWSDGVTVDLRKVGAVHPVFGLMDGIQWLLFAAAHLERHRAQVVGLKRHARFPAGG